MEFYGLKEEEKKRREQLKRNFFVTPSPAKTPFVVTQSVWGTEF